jgi:serine/threonine protein kinase
VNVTATPQQSHAAARQTHGKRASAEMFHQSSQKLTQSKDLNGAARIEHMSQTENPASKLHMTEMNTDIDDDLSDPGLPMGTVLLDGLFTITRRLSAGGFGITYLAHDNVLGREIVLKECFPEELCVRADNAVRVRTAGHVKTFQSIIDMFMHEARSLAKLRHLNVVGVHRAFEENNTAYMALDLIDGHDLLDILETDTGTQLPPERVKGILIDLLGAIETIHQHDLLHRDISPDNIIIEKTGTPVLIDFGAARADASRRTRAVSSMIIVKDGYSPQEFYVAGSIQTPSSDLYALAATFYHVVSGEAPPNSQIRMAEMVGQSPDPCVPLAGRINGYSTVFLETIDKAMSVVPRDRLQSAKEWLALIDGDRSDIVHVSQAVTTAPAKPISKDISRLLTRMIEETNEVVENARPIEIEATPKRAPSQPQTEQAAWLKEFNEESLEKEAQACATARPAEPALQPWVQSDVAPEQHFPAEYAPPMPKPVSHVTNPADYTEPNWAIRVMEKKQRELAAMEDHFMAANPQVETAKVHSKASFTAPPVEGAPLLEPLARYLVTGMVLGLGVASYLIFPKIL